MSADCSASSVVGQQRYNYGKLARLLGVFIISYLWTLWVFVFSYSALVIGLLRTRRHEINVLHILAH